MITSKWLPLFSTTFFRKSNICCAPSCYTITRWLVWVSTLRKSYMLNTCIQ